MRVFVVCCLCIVVSVYFGLFVVLLVWLGLFACCGFCLTFDFGMVIGVDVIIMWVPLGIVVGVCACVWVGLGCLFVH